MSFNVINGVLDPMLKIVWPEMEEMFYQKDQAMPLLEMIDSGSKIPFRGMAEGLYYKFPLVTANGQNAAVGIGEESSLPYESEPTLDAVTGNVASHWQGVNITGFAMDMVDGGQTSVVPAMRLLLEDNLKSFKKRLNWLMHQDGSQLLTTATNSTDTFTVTSAAQLSNDTRFLYRLKASPGTLATATTGNTAALPCKVSALNRTALTFTALTSTGGAPSFTTDSSSNYGIYPHNGQGKGMYGLGAICASGNLSNYGASTNFMGKDATAAGNEYWNAKEVDCDDSILDIQNHVQVLLDKIRADALEFCNPNEEGITWLVPTRWHNYRAITNALRLDYRSMADEKVLRNTFKSVEYEGAFFVPDNDAPVDELRFANLQYLRRFVPVPLTWNNKSLEWLQGTASEDSRTNDTYRRWLYTRQNLFTIMRKAHGRIHDLLATA